MRPPPRLLIARSCALLLLAASNTGCIVLGAGAVAGASVATVTPPAVGADTSSRQMVGHAVRFTFAASVPRQARGPRGDSIGVGSLRSVVGRVMEQRGDSIWIMLAETQDAEGRRNSFPFGRGPELAVEARADGTLHTIRAGVSRDERVLRGAGVGMAATVLAIIGLCSITRCLD